MSARHFKALANLGHHRVLFVVLQRAWVSGGRWLRVLLIVICRRVTVPAPVSVVHLILLVPNVSPL